MLCYTIRILYYCILYYTNLGVPVPDHVLGHRVAPRHLLLRQLLSFEGEGIWNPHGQA